MDFFVLLKMFLGFVGIVFVRAITKNTRRFDFFIWLKYDFQRLMVGLGLLLVTWAIYLLEPEALKLFSAVGLELSDNSAVLIGASLAGVTLWIPANNPSK